MDDLPSAKASRDLWGTWGPGRRRSPGEFFEQRRIATRYDDDSHWRSAEVLIPASERREIARPERSQRPLGTAGRLVGGR